MTSSLTRYGFLGLKVLVALAFVAAGLAKLSGVPMMVATFDALGLGQWFRYLTGAIEIGAAVALFVPGAQLMAAALLMATMVGAILSHLLVVGPSAVPATVLLLLLAVIAYGHRNQLPGRTD